MKNLFLICCSLLFLGTLKAQTFSVTHTDTIPDNNTTVVFDVVVSGLPSVIDTNFGLETACLNMYHTYCSDMEVQLQAPDGTTICCFQASAAGTITFSIPASKEPGRPLRKEQHLLPARSKAKARWATSTMAKIRMELGTCSAATWPAQTSGF
ncbi:MAG: hypothetical protein IPP17_28425 [Bacteroidetes bacterium]|nr:hypothetical protein [Bacteroidota bacterium]